jgi:hypothetical protein
VAQDCEKPCTVVSIARKSQRVARKKPRTEYREKSFGTCVEVSLLFSRRKKSQLDSLPSDWMLLHLFSTIFIYTSKFKKSS